MEKWFEYRLSLSLCVIATAAAAQTSTPSQPPPFTSVPPIEDSELVYSFFNYQQALFTTLSAAIAANPQNSTLLDQQTADLLHVNVTELPIVIATTAQVSQDYANAGREPSGRRLLATGGDTAAHGGATGLCIRIPEAPAHDRGGRDPVSEAVAGVLERLARLHGRDL